MEIGTGFLLCKEMGSDGVRRSRAFVRGHRSSKPFVYIRECSPNLHTSISWFSHHRPNVDALGCNTREWCGQHPHLEIPKHRHQHLSTLLSADVLNAFSVALNTVIMSFKSPAKREEIESATGRLC